MDTSVAPEIYLDANATTQVIPQAAAAACDAMNAVYGNPSSSHTSGLRARNILESTRELARTVLGSATGQIVFTSGATEAIQMAIFSALCDLRERPTSSGQERPVLMYGATEHKAVPQAIKHWNELLGLNLEVFEIPVDRQGALDLMFLAQHANRAGLICTMAVNNETGVITDLAAVEKLIRDVNSECAWLVDCVQSIGKMPLRLAQTTIDYAAFSGHKIFAPKGIGFLYARQHATLVPLLAGGGQEAGVRGGTENLPGVAAIGAVLELLADSSDRTFVSNDTLLRYRSMLLAALKSAFPTIGFNTPTEKSVPTTINFSVKGFESRELTNLFDAAAMRVSSGSACGAKARSSYVLEAMGLDPWRCLGAIRMSFSPLTEEAEVEAACKRIQRVGEVMHDACPVVANSTDNISGNELHGLIQLKSGVDCTWLLMDAASRRCVIIDPFESLAERIETLVRCQRSNVIAVLDTHAHVDHESCRRQLLGALSEFQSPIACSDDLLGWPTVVDGVCRLGDGSEAPWLRVSDDLVIAKTDLPGHTEVGVAYLVGSLVEDELRPENVRFMLSGDMILMGGLGRTDFASSSVKKMYQSLQRIPKLIDLKTVICPTHDYKTEFATTLETELNGNAFLKSLAGSSELISYEEFASVKPELDARIVGDSSCELVCGLINKEDTTEQPSAIDIKDLALDPDALLIDVREPQEFAFEYCWAELGFTSTPRNVPLTQLSGFLPEVLQGDLKTCRIVFVCRTGKRSGLAAKLVRRLGVKQVQHIAGGLALNTSASTSQSQPEMDYMI